MDFQTYPKIGIVKQYFVEKFPYFAKVFEKRFEDFGKPWAEEFENELHTFFGDDQERLEKAAHGYGKFALDGLRLQKKFDKKLEYENKTYEDCKDEVYLNKDYMFSLYLPGILLSHYLWPHHYNQKIWFKEKFLPFVQNENTFGDVGVGTGFYSKEMLKNLSKIQGQGHDISEHSLEHTLQMLTRWKLKERYTTHHHDIVKEPLQEKLDCIVNVEVLEHLEDPVDFLKGLRKMIKDGGYGFVTAAIDAPNADHIYLYRSLEDVSKELNEAKFEVVEEINFAAFENPKPGETVPQNGAFIVRAI